MSKVLIHNGYKGVVEFDAEDEIFVGHIMGIDDIVGFHADSVAGLKAAFVDVVDDYIATCKKIGKKPQKSYSGNLMLRIDPKVHSDLAIAAESAGKSLNQWSEEILRRALESSARQERPAR